MGIFPESSDLQEYSDFSISYFDEEKAAFEFLSEEVQKLKAANENSIVYLVHDDDGAEDFSAAFDKDERVHIFDLSGKYKRNSRASERSKPVIF